VVARSWIGGHDRSGAELVRAFQLTEFNGLARLDPATGNLRTGLLGHNEFARPRAIIAGSCF
jgi:hypothetical protein